jgi:YVTN family beta-propeller protein
MNTMRLAVAVTTVVLLGGLTAAPAQEARGPLLVASVPEQEAVNLYRLIGWRIEAAGSVKVGKGPGRMCAADGLVYAATAAGVAVVDVARPSLAGTLSDPGLKAAFHCTVSPDGGKVYVTDRESAAVFVFSTSSRQLLAKITVPEDPRHSVFTPDGKSLVVSCGDPNVLAVVDPAKNTVVREIKAVGLDPRALLVTPDGKNLVVGLTSSDIMSWYDAKTLEHVNSFGVARSPQFMVTAGKGERIYVAGAYNGEIAVVDARESKGDGTPEPRQTSTIPVGPVYSIAISADGDYVFAAPTGGNGTIVDLRSFKVTKPPALKGASALLYLP